MQNQSILLKARPEGRPTLAHFDLVDTPTPSLEAGEVLLETLYLSVDPYLRGRMRDVKSYVPPFQVGEPLNSGGVAKVIESKNPDFQEGDIVLGHLHWTKLQKGSADLRKIDTRLAPASAYLSVLGMTGLTAYFGLTDIGQPKAGETLVVSGAAGAVGSVVGQIGKLLGCRVIGIAGSDEKTQWLIEELGFDAAINYKTTEDMQKALAAVCPDGIDIYFDNVGGAISDAVMTLTNDFARIPLCGAISMYNETSVPMGPRLDGLIIQRRVRLQGFIVSDYTERFPEGIQQLATWIQQGKLQLRETVVEGFAQTPQAFIDLFEGKNIGKMVVKTS